MPAADLSSYLVSSGETSSATKMDNMINAIQTYLNSIDDAKVSSGAAIAVSKLAAGTNGFVLTTSGGVPTWVAASGAPTYQTTLPGSPSDGQTTILVDSTAAPTYQWYLRYNATTTKWHFLGGIPGFSEVTASETTSSGVGTYQALGTAGPSFALPVAGDYDVTIGAALSTSAVGGTVMNMSYDIGGTGAVDADSIRVKQPSGNSPGVSSMRTRRKTGLTAVTLTAKYKTSATDITAQDRWMSVVPVKLG